MQNLEIKARVPNKQRAMEALTTFSGQSPRRIRQTDTYFAVPVGRLKLREEYNHTELIFYVRPDELDSKTSEYVRVPVSEPAMLKNLLSKMFDVDVVVRKTRDLLFLGSTRIHLDSVDGLGDFLEIEAPMENEGDHESAEKIIESLLSELPWVPEMVPGSYSDMLRQPR